MYLVYTLRYKQKHSLVCFVLQSNGRWLLYIQTYQILYYFYIMKMSASLPFSYILNIIRSYLLLLLLHYKMFNIYFLYHIIIIYIIFYYKILTFVFNIMIYQFLHYKIFIDIFVYIIHYLYDVLYNIIHQILSIYYYIYFLFIKCSLILTVKHFQKSVISRKKNSKVTMFNTMSFLLLKSHSFGSVAKY